MSLTTQPDNGSGFDRFLTAVNVFVAAAALIWVVHLDHDADGAEPV